MNRHHPESVTVKEPKAHQCTLCPRNFKFKSRLISHVKKDHEKEKEVLLEIMKSEKAETFICDYCSREFEYQSHLQNHVKRVHERIKNLNCDSCDKVFDNPSTLKF